MLELVNDSNRLRTILQKLVQLLKNHERMLGSFKELKKYSENFKESYLSRTFE